MIQFTLGVSTRTKKLAKLMGIALLAATAQAQASLFDNSQVVHVVNLINQAKFNIDIEIYEMDDPTVLAAIRGALARGVHVRIVKEPSPVGASCHVFDPKPPTPLQPGRQPKLSQPATCQDQAALVHEVNASGGQYVPFNKPTLCGGTEHRYCFQHGKLLMIDSQVALISSGNFNISNLCDLQYQPEACNRDYSYVTNDPTIVGTLRAIFEKDLKGQKYNVGAMIKGGSAAALTVSPNSLAPLVAFIRSAKHSILLQNQYLKDPTLNATLIEAARRGVRVDLNISSFCSFGLPTGKAAQDIVETYRAFDAAGINTRMFDWRNLVNGQPGYLHAKAIVVDGNRAWMGSTNGSTNALNVNREYGIFLSDPNDIELLKRTIQSDFSRGETWLESINCAEKPYLQQALSRGFIGQ